jgi:TetR/AcrR family transcriptional regulator, repressor for lfrA
MDESERGARARTRRAILDAALSVLSDNPGAPLADIAEAADVGRSTLHRYFPERTDLIRALALHVHALSSAAIAAAEPACGPPVAALRRVVESHLEIGAIVGYIYTDPAVLADPELVAHMDTGDEVIVDILNRATVDRPDIPPGWARRVFWSLLQAGFDAMKFDAMPRHQVTDAIMASLTQATISSS